MHAEIMRKYLRNVIYIITHIVSVINTTLSKKLEGTCTANLPGHKCHKSVVEKSIYR